jgi:hypothetical protein
VSLCRAGEPFEEPAHRLGHWLRDRGERLRATGFGHGRAGVGDALLGLGRVLEDREIEDGARDAARWLLGVSHRPGRGQRAWAAAAGLETPDPTWGRGTAGVASFLLNLHDADGDPAALEASRETTAWLRRVADRPSEGRLAFPTRVETEPHALSGRVVRCTGTVRGAAGILEAFLKLRRVEGDEEAGRAAREAATWLLDVAEDTGDGGLRWPYAEGSGRHDTGLLAGTAGVGSTLLRLHEAFPDAGYDEAARRAARWLESVAEPQGDDGLAWWDIIETDDPGEKRFHRTGLHGGAAGIGTFFLLLHRSRDLE